VFKEHVEEGKRVVRVLVPSQEAMYRFPPGNWALAQLFDGNHTYEEIAGIYSKHTGQEYSTDEVREFAASLELLDFWYKTPQEKNILLMQKDAQKRKKLLKAKKSKYGDLAEIAFPAVNPDKFLTWLHSYTSFIYTWWFTLVTLGVFAIMAAITIVFWSEIGRDTLQFFNFTTKNMERRGIFYVGRGGVDVLARNRSWTRMQALRRPRASHGLLVDLSHPCFLHRYLSRSCLGQPLSTSGDRSGRSLVRVVPLCCSHGDLVAFAAGHHSAFGRVT